MDNYTYKCVPVPTIVEIGKNKHFDAIKAYEDKINKIAKDLLSEENNYITYWNNKKNNSSKKFIEDIITNNFGFVDNLNTNGNKPVQLYPISAVQKSLEINKEDYSKIIRKNILKHLKEVTIYFIKYSPSLDNYFSKIS